MTNGWYRVENAASTPDRAVIRIYDLVGGWFGVTAAAFVKDLDAITAKTIELHVNSPGGDVFDSLAIMNSLRQHDARVIAYVDGMAASAASFIVTGGSDEVVMGLGTELMIHNPMAMTMGDADLHRDSAARLEKIRDDLAAIYMAKAGGDVEEWRAAMSAETWYTAEEAVEAGLADRVDEALEPEPVSNRSLLAVFNYAGRSKAPPPRTPAASASGPTEKEEAPMSFTNDLRQRLGIADENADEATILAALDEAMTERADPPSTETPPVPEVAPVQASSGKLPAGAVIIDQSTLDGLQASARRADEVASRLAADDRDRAIAAAVQDGKITPARVEHWKNAWKADPEGAKQALDSMPKNLVPVNPIGSSANDFDEDSAEYASLFPPSRKG